MRNKIRADWCKRALAAVGLLQNMSDFPKLYEQDGTADDAVTELVDFVKFVIDEGGNTKGIEPWTGNEEVTEMEVPTQVLEAMNRQDSCIDDLTRRLNDAVESNLLLAEEKTKISNDLSLCSAENERLRIDAANLTEQTAEDEANTITLNEESDPDPVIPADDIPLDEGGSKSSVTGYKGVAINKGCKSKPFRVQVWENGAVKSLGSFLTALDGAIARAEYIKDGKLLANLKAKKAAQAVDLDAVEDEIAADAREDNEVSDPYGDIIKCDTCGFDAPNGCKVGWQCDQVGCIGKYGIVKVDPNE